MNYYPWKKTQPDVCPRCQILFEMHRQGKEYIHMVLPPHDRRCPKILQFKPEPLS